MLDFAEPVPRRLRKLFSPEAPPITGVGFIALAASLLRTIRFISFFLDVFWGRLAPGSGARKVKLGGMLSGAGSEPQIIRGLLILSQHRSHFHSQSKRQEGA